MEWDWKKETNRDAIVIVRVSSRKQEENTSLAHQEKEITKYCRERQLNIVDVVHLVESARTSKKRAGYHEAIKKALKFRIKHIIFWVGDREARNATDLERNDELIKEGKIVVHHVRNRKVYWKNTPQMEMLSRHLDGLISKDAVERHAVRVNDGTIAKAEQGWWPHCKPILGYVSRRFVNEDGVEMKSGMARMVPDPNKANIRQVQREFELRAMGFGVERIRDKVLEEGLVPTHRIKSYNSNSIEKRLKHPFYHGFFEWKGKEYKGKHELIIPKDILKRVKDSWTSPHFTPGPLSRDGLFSGWIRCGLEGCGMVIIYEPKAKLNKTLGKKQVYPYYHCSNSRFIHESMKGLSIREEKIFEAFEPSLEGIQITTKFAEDIIAALKEAETRTEAAIRQQIEQFSLALSELDKKDDNASDAYLEGVLDRDGLGRMRSRIRAERSDYLKRLEEAQVQISVSGVNAVKKILELCTQVKSLWKNATNEKRVQYLKIVYQNPILEGGSLRFDYQKPFKLVSEMRGNPLWWRLAGSNR